MALGTFEGIRTPDPRLRSLYYLGKLLLFRLISSLTSVIFVIITQKRVFCLINSVTFITFVLSLYQIIPFIY